MPARVRCHSRARVARGGTRLIARCALGLLTALTACGDGDTIVIKGDVEGLDTLALRGDSLIARADRPPDDIFYTPPSRLADSIAAVTAGTAPSGTRADSGQRSATRRGADVSTASVAGTLEIPAAGRLTGAEMSRRAQLRGDSIARALASQSSGGLGDGGRSRADSVRGVVVVQGSAEAPQVMLQTGNATMSLSGMATRGLLRLEGNEIVVRGVKVSPRDIVVADYIVRTAKGLPVLDGVIADGGALRLTDGSGVRRVALPAEVRSLVGTRVWVAMRGANPAAFGILATR